MCIKLMNDTLESALCQRLFKSSQNDRSPVKIKLARLAEVPYNLEDIIVQRYYYTHYSNQVFPKVSRRVFTKSYKSRENCYVYDE